MVMGLLYGELLLFQPLHRIKNKPIPRGVYGIYLGSALGVRFNSIKLFWYLRLLIIFPGCTYRNYTVIKILLLSPCLLQGCLGGFLQLIMGGEVFVVWPHSNSCRHGPSRNLLAGMVTYKSISSYTYLVQVYMSLRRIIQFQ